MYGTHGGPPPDTTCPGRLHRASLGHRSCRVAAAPRFPKPLPPSDSDRPCGSVALRLPRVTPHQGRERKISLAPLGPRPLAASLLRATGNARTHNLITPSWTHCNPSATAQRCPLQPSVCSRLPRRCFQAPAACGRSSTHFAWMACLVTPFSCLTPRDARQGRPCTGHAATSRDIHRFTLAPARATDHTDACGRF
jgi:hypothetical protein